MIRWMLFTALLILSGSCDGNVGLCAQTGEGCPCEPSAAPSACYERVSDADGGIQCGSGHRVCDDGIWTACQIEETVEDGPISSTSQALVDPGSRCSPCEPGCTVARDYPSTRDLTPENSDNVVYDPARGALTTSSTEASSSEAFGPGSGHPFDLDEGDARGLRVAPDGALEIASSTIASDFIWIANTSEGTVSRFDTRTYAETGRFFTGPGGRSNDPSRTSVNTRGDVYVANRRGGGVARISNLGEYCPDSNRDGVITTSSSSAALPWGRDDCVLWHRDLRPVLGSSRLWVRAVAAQDRRNPVTGEFEEYVWVGEYSTRRVVLLDGQTGDVLLVTRVASNPYGMALDRAGNLWVASQNRQTLRDRGGSYNLQGPITRIDTNRCGRDGCPSAPYSCVSGWDWGRRRAINRNCDSHIKEAIGAPSRPYGITVDFRQRVWIGGGDVSRYDPSASPRNRWTRAGISRRSRDLDHWGGACHGIAADGDGWIWCAAERRFHGLWRISGDDPRGTRRLLARATRGWGVGVDSDGKIWSVNRYDGGRAAVITPGPRIDQNPYTIQATALRDPYTYSDMTGQQLRLAADPRGFYYLQLEGCPDGTPTSWQNLEWDAETPAGTRVGFRVRTGDTLDALRRARWVHVAVSPPDGSPADVAAALAREGVPSGQLLEVEAMLETDTPLEEASFRTPRLRGVNVTRSCGRYDPGSYTQIYDATLRCMIPPNRPQWRTFRYRTDTPDDSKVIFVFRTANQRSRLATATAIRVSVPLEPDIGEFDTGERLRMAGLDDGNAYLQVQALLEPSTDRTRAPLLFGFEQEYVCLDAE